MTHFRSIVIVFIILLPISILVAMIYSFAGANGILLFTFILMFAASAINLNEAPQMPAE